jgi:hypothetical protein
MPNSVIESTAGLPAPEDIGLVREQGEDRGIDLKAW